MIVVVMVCVTRVNVTAMICGKVLIVAKSLAQMIAVIKAFVLKVLENVNVMKATLEKAASTAFAKWIVELMATVTQIQENAFVPMVMEVLAAKRLKWMVHQ
jgi:hypothetical protein